MTNFFLTCKECILESPTNFYGCFYLGPFNSSQSLTVANGLRRTLLSEIPGLGIESIEIEGVEHEFCTFPGIRESILDLLLNFKEIVLKYNNTNEEKTHKKTVYRNKKPLYGYLQARGPGIIRASDLKLPASVINVDPNQYIATLTTDGLLNLRFTICEGFTNTNNPTIKSNQTNKNLVENGFSWLYENENIKKNEMNLIEEAYASSIPSNNSSSDSSFLRSTKPETSLSAEEANAKRGSKLKGEISEKISGVSSKNIGDNILSKTYRFKNSKVLWLDPLFTPILKVNYIIESYGSLELNPTNQVILLELWTNGSLHPRDALYSALSELNIVFSKLEQMKILNNIFAKSFTQNKFFSKILKKVKYDYGFYKSENLKKFKKNSNNLDFDQFPISSNLFSIMIGNSEKIETKRIEKGIKDNNESKNLENNAKENISIESLSLPFRIKNSLKNANITNIQNLLNYQVEDLKKIPGIGNQSIILLIKKLNEKGLKFKR